ncbi:hypothetical protein K7X08_014263 [Anisodus acutangulus]|uniref:Protein kinase domain-containing protein n=1 Tax=Anisodus acutangulus TaxID=402998 RepID=A0A9Q1LI85_9SOLA|nr:hypothetical protein K7X08_014263 [Anisodus acutangulus]
MASFNRMVVQPSPWLPGTCVTQDMPVSEGLWLNQTLPFNVTSSNTIFLFNCSPRLLVSPLNCTPSSLCHKYLQSSGYVDPKRELQCASGVDPCCTFIAGGMPSAYKIRLHISGCRAFRSVLHLDAKKPANEWEEGLEIQWSPPPEPPCRSQSDCSGASTCLASGKNGVFRCFCKNNHYWNQSLGTCMKKKHSGIIIKISIGIVLLLTFSVVVIVVTLKNSGRFSTRARLAKAREDILKSNNGGKSTRMFCLKEIKKATNGFSEDRILGRGGFREVYKGELRDGTIVAVKLAKVGNIKSTQQVLNEVGILSQVNHRNLVKFLGCCVEAEQPLMIYEYISNGTLHDHLHEMSNLQTYSSITNSMPKFRLWPIKIGMSTVEPRVHLCSRNVRAVDFSRNEDSFNLVVYVIQQENRGSVMDVVDRRLLGEEPLSNVMSGVNASRSWHLHLRV